MAISDKITSIQNHLKDDWDSVESLIGDTELDKNIENISSALDDLYNDLPKVTGSGTSITLDDTRVGKIKSTLKGNTSQNGTPTPTSPIPVNVVSGDNEINVNGKNFYNSSDTTYYEACTYVSGANTNQYKVKATGTDVIINLQISSGTSYSSVAGTLIPCKYGETIYYDTGNSNFGKNIVTQYNSNKVSLGFSALNTGSSSGSYTPTNSNCEYISIRIGYGSATSGTEYTLAPIFSKTSNLIYEPYQGNTYNIDLPTENKFDISKITENTFLNGDGTTGASSVTNLSDYMRILPSKPCTISYTYTTLMNTNQRGYCWYTENKTYISGNTYTLANAPITITAPSNAKYIRFAYDKNCTNIQLQQSSKATPYGTTPIELCSSPDGIKRDYFLHDKTIDKWHWHREIGKVVLVGDNSEDWDGYADGSDYFYHSTSILETTGNYVDGYSSHFRCLPYYPNVAGTFAFRGDGKQLSIRVNGITSVADFKTWLETNKPIVYYILATPTNIEITYQPLIDQLNLLEKAMSKDSQTNISQENNDLPFEIDASALEG